MSPSQPCQYMRVPPVQFTTTTAADMGRLAQFLMSDGRIQDERYIALELLVQFGGAQGPTPRAPASR